MSGTGGSAGGLGANSGGEVSGTGGAAGTSIGSYTAECVSTHPGGTLDGQVTTEHVFKMRRTGAGNS